MKKILSTYIQELKGCVSDTGVLVFLVLVPLGYPLLYSYIYSQEVVRNIPVAVVDLSQSSLSREFLRKVDATPDIAIAQNCTNIAAARRQMEEDRVKGIIYIPQKFAQNVENGIESHISIYCSMASFFYYKAILSGCTEVSLAMNSVIQGKRIGGATNEEIRIFTAPLPNRAVGLSNPTTGFADFVIPAILVLILQQIMLLGIGMRMGTLYSEGKKSAKGLIGKSAAYLTITAPMAAYVLCVIPRIFGLSQIADGTTLVLFMLPYMLACTLLAITAGSFIKSREAPMLLFVFTSIPLLFLSGISWPGSNIPIFWKIFSYIFPSTPAINGFVAINCMGAGLEDVIFEYAALWIQVAVYAFLSYLATSARNKIS